MASQIVYTMQRLGPGVDISFSMTGSRQDEIGSSLRADQVRLTIDVGQQGNPDNPPHWQPPYRPGQTVDVVIDRGRLSELIQELRELL